MLKKESLSSNENVYDVLLRSINWKSLSSYDLWLLLKETFPKVNLLMTKYSLVFSLVCDTNYANISNDEFEILRELGRVKHSRAIKGIMNNGTLNEKSLTREDYKIRLNVNRKMWDELKEFAEL